MAHSAKLWAKIKTDYESGEYSYPKLAEKHKISEATIIAKSQRDDWQKGKIIPAIEKTIQQKFIDAFAKKGFDENKVADVIDKMSMATKPTIVQGFGEHVKRGEGEAQGFVAEIEDWQARDKAITQYAKITGSYAADKQEFTGKNGTPLIPRTITVRIAKLDEPEPQ